MGKISDMVYPLYNVPICYTSLGRQNKIGEKKKNVLRVFRKISFFDDFPGIFDFFFQELPVHGYITDGIYHIEYFSQVIWHTKELL